MICQGLRLLIEKQPDIELVFEAKDGREAVEHVRELLSEVVIMDLSMPKMNGIEFLKIVKEDEKLKRFPVIVLTTSTEEQDKVDSFNLGVAGYMLKPVDYQQFVEVVRTIHLYWTLSELPGKKKVSAEN